MATSGAPPGAKPTRMRALRERLGAAARRKPWLVPAAVVVAAFAVTILGPGYLASQPTFLDRFANLQRFHSTWSTSTHAEVTCQSCHVPPDTLSQLTYNARMVGEFYLSAVSPGRRPVLFGKPPNASCQECHEANRSVSPRGDLRIPHRAHVQVLKMRCIGCHGFVVHLKNPEGTHTPRMTSCLTCHDGKRAKNACTVCHKRKAAPVSHRSANWLVIHPKMQKKVDCKECHGWVRNWCRECHTRRPVTHGRRWRSQHQYKVARHRNCEACHKGRFCVRCHGEVPSLNRSKAPKFVE